MNINIQIPFFPGLYESELYSSDTDYYAIQEELRYYQDEYCSEWGPGEPDEKFAYEQLTEDDLDFDGEGYKKEIVAAYVDAFEDNAPDIVLSVKYTEMLSPRYYNYSTDRIFADIELSEDWEERMKDFMSENAEWLKDRIKKDWTSYDGFISFMSNNFDNTAHDGDEGYWGDKSWYWHLFEDTAHEDERSLYISTMLGYMMYRKNEDVKWDLCSYALESVSDSIYVYITDEGKEKIERLKAQREEDIREGRIALPDPAQMEIPFSE